MKQQLTKGIVLSRIDYGEADRILTLLTPELGKLRLMARGVRKAKSKLAGGIELFSTAEISFISGRGEIGTLTSARLIKYYSSIVQNIDRVQLGYELIKLLHRATEDQPESQYYDLLENAFIALDTVNVSIELIRLWFIAQLLHHTGHSPNLHTDKIGQKLIIDQNYSFDFDEVSFTPQPKGNFNTDDIKFLRLIFSGNQAVVLARVAGIDVLTQTSLPLVQTMLNTYI